MGGYNLAAPHFIYTSPLLLSAPGLLGLLGIAGLNWTSFMHGLDSRETLTYVSRNWWIPQKTVLQALNTKALRRSWQDEPLWPQWQPAEGHVLAFASPPF